MQKYRTPLVNFLYRMVRDSATAEDLAQEVFLRVYRARKQYTPSAKFTTWLFRIATNLALNSVRDNRHRQMEVSIDAPTDDEDAAPMELPAREMRIDEHMMERDRAEFIRRAIIALPEKQRAAVLLHKYEEMDYAEIAKSSGLLGKRAEIAAFPRIREPAGATGSACGPAGGASRRGRKAIMKCEEVSKELIAYLDRRANSAERREWKNIWPAARACRKRARKFRASLWTCSG